MGTLRLKLAVVVRSHRGRARVAAVAIAHDRGAFKAKLAGFTEVPAVITDGNGRFEAQDQPAPSRRSSGRSTTSGPNAPNVHAGAHPHRPGVRRRPASPCGCAPTTPPITGAPAGTQPCPPAPADISGTITPADVIGPLNQGIGPGQFDRLVRAMRSGLTYANVHTELSPGGEIRGQIHGGKGADRD